MIGHDSCRPYGPNPAGSAISAIASPPPTPASAQAADCDCWLRFASCCSIRLVTCAATSDEMLGSWATVLRMWAISAAS